MLVETPPTKGPQPERAPDTVAAQGAQRGLSDLLALKSALLGSSAVDGGAMWFDSREAVDDFLRLNEYDTDNPLDLTRLRELHREATIFLAETLRYRLPKKIENPGEIHDLFLWATQGSRRLQRFSCMALKVMHILHHLEGRQLVYRTATSEEQLFERLNTKVFAVIDRMRHTGIGVQEFSTGHKSRSSMVTKLLAKRSTVAGQIFDKLRFRIVLTSRDDLVLALVYLTRHLFPFNYVVPEQSHNTVITEDDLVRVLDVAPDVVRKHWREAEGLSVAGPMNEFSGRTYRSVNFVADIPVRIDDLVPDAAPAIAFAQAEIQLLDGETERANNLGENAHPLYKRRQRARVRRRLEGPGRGLEPTDRWQDEED